MKFKFNLEKTTRKEKIIGAIGWLVVILLVYLKTRGII